MGTETLAKFEKEEKVAKWLTMLLKRLLNSTKLIQVDPCSFSLLVVIIEVDSYYIKKGIYILDMIFQIQ